MKKDEFLDLINDIDDKFLNELAESEPGEKRVDLPPEEYGAPQKPQVVRLERPPKNRASFIAVFAAVACAAAVMLGVVFIAKNIGDIPIVENSSGVVPPNDSTGVSIGKTNTSGDTQISSQKCKIYKQKARIFTEEQLLALFDEAPQRADKSREDQICIVYTSEKHTGYLINNRILKFYSKTGSYYSMICDYLCRNTDDKTYISKDDELDFASREKVFEDLRSLLNDQFGISPDEWLIEDCFAVTRNGIDFYHTEEAAANPEHFNNSAVHDIPIEDFYSINIKFQIDRIPIYTGESLDYGVAKIYGSTASVIISESGIQSICLSNLNETDMSPEGSMELTPIRPEAAKELIQEKFSGFLPEEKGDVYDMRLIYLPIPVNDSDKNCESFIAKPHYALYWKRTGNNNGTTSISNFISYYDAVTGEDFLTKQISS